MKTYTIKVVSEIATDDMSETADLVNTYTVQAGSHSALNRLIIETYACKAAFRHAVIYQDAECVGIWDHSVQLQMDEV